MPKDRSNCDYSCPRGSPYKSYPYHGKTAPSRSNKLDEDDSTMKKAWEAITCPICMEMPHNAVLLKCSSYEKGCRPYMCDTSYRHSNCLDQYRKAQMMSHKNRQENGLGEDDENSLSSDVLDNNTTVSMLQHSRSVHVASTSQGLSHVPESMSTEGDYDGWTLRLTGRIPQTGGASSDEGHDMLGLVCPLCRGHVKGWDVIKAARHYLNKKIRSCAREACSFAGSYEELRAHARRDHPSARPAEIDPARQRDWMHLEQQRDLGDVLSTIRSAMPGATIMGDYIIDNEEDHLHNYESDSSSSEDHLLTVFLLFQVLGSPHSAAAGRRVLPQFRGVVRGHRRTGSTRRRRWGNSLHWNLNNEGSNSSGSRQRELPAGSSFRRHRRIQRRSEG